MKRLVFLAAAIALLPGCTAELGLRIGNVTAPSTQPTVGPGGSISGSAVGMRFGDAPGYGALLGAGILGWIFGGEQRTPPELDPSRPVQEQDCTRPVENASANLRCR